MAADCFEVLEKAFQRKIRLAYQKEGAEGSVDPTLPELNQLIFELFGLNKAESEAIYGGADSVPNGGRIELRPRGVQGYDDNIDALERDYAHKLQLATELGESKGGALRIEKLNSEIGFIEEVEFVAPKGNSPLFLENKRKFNDFLRKWREVYTNNGSSTRVTQYDMVWNQISDGIPKEFRSTGARVLCEKLTEVLSPQSSTYRTVLFWAPLPTELAGMDKNYTMHIFEGGSETSLSSDEATATLMALTLLGRGDVCAKIREIVEGTQLSEFFDLLPYHPRKMKEFYIFTEPGWGDDDGPDSRGERVLFRFNSREVGKPYSAKKLYSDADKKELDSWHIAFNMTVTAGHTNSLLCVLKLPLITPPGGNASRTTAPEPPSPCVYAPKFWAEMITTNKETLGLARNLASPVRGVFKEAFKTGRDPANELPTYDYDFF